MILVATMQLATFAILSTHYQKFKVAKNINNVFTIFTDKCNYIWYSTNQKEFSPDIYKTLWSSETILNMVNFTKKKSIKLIKQQIMYHVPMLISLTETSKFQQKRW